MCPAIGREITSAECGEHRGSRYACPADCAFSPLAPANYSQLLELEGAVDKKSAEWLFTTAPDAAAFDAAGRAASRSKSGHALHAFFAHRIFFHTDESGRTCAQRWEQAGLPGLRNDERVLFRGKMSLRVALVETRRILDHERIEAVDLLDADPRPFLVMDRSLASLTARFSTFLCWMYALPHFRRMHGTAIVIPDWQVFDAREIVEQIVGHLGGPLDEPGLRRWLAANFVRFDESLAAVGLARRRQMFEAMDAKFGKAIYELRRPFAECRETLDAECSVDDEPLSDGERNEGFAEARAWFAEPGASPVALPEGGRPVLGRVLLGQSHWRLEAMGEAKLAALRTGFERLMGERAQFTGERLDDLGAAMAEKDPKPDPLLIPPSLLEQPQRILLSSSRVDPPVRPGSRAEAEEHLFTAHERAWIDQPLEALGGLSPRTAAGQPGLRARLVRMMKSRVRSCDEHNLRTGGRRDVNWMLRELGLQEILFDPPPPRAATEAPLDADDREEEGAVSLADPSLPPAPPLPTEPFSLEEAGERLRVGLEELDSAAEALETMEAAGSTLIEDVDEITAGLIDDETFTLLIPFLIQAWFAFVPPGTRGPELDFDRLSNGIRSQTERILEMVRERSEASFNRFFNSGPQPHLSLMLTGMMIQSTSTMPRKACPTPEVQAVMACVLLAVVEELDLACRSTPVV
jgi:hypothetical protein